MRARRAGVSRGDWVTCLYTLYAAVVLILVRSVFRAIEYGTSSGANTGKLLSMEGLFYALEAV